MQRLLPQATRLFARTGPADCTFTPQVRAYQKVAAVAPTWQSKVSTRCYTTSSVVENVPKAALLLIGNEILSGSIVDANTPWLAKILYNRGIDLIRVEVIPDDVQEIKDTVLQLKRRVGENGIVFTSGGIGPTHDDVTYAAIAAAFGATLRKHQPTVERMQESYSMRGLELNEARLRMATLPEPATQVLFTEGLWVPLVVLDGVHILPGIPRLFKQMIEANLSSLPRGPSYVRQELGTQMAEGDLSEILSQIAEKWPQVAIGSYPDVTGKYSEYQVLLRFEGRDGDAVASATSAAREQLPTFDIL